jgi:hypothetical protein
MLSLLFRQRSNVNGMARFRTMLPRGTSTSSARRRPLSRSPCVRTTTQARQAHTSSAFIYTYLHTSTHMYTCTYTQAHTSTHIYTCTCTHLHTYIRILTHRYMHIYTHIHPDAHSTYTGASVSRSAAKSRK